jgi:hypothetical protein
MLNKRKFCITITKAFILISCLFLELKANSQVLILSPDSGNGKSFSYETGQRIFIKINDSKRFCAMKILSLSNDTGIYCSYFGINAFGKVRHKAQADSYRIIQLEDVKSVGRHFYVRKALKWTSLALLLPIANIYGGRIITGKINTRLSISIPIVTAGMVYPWVKPFKKYKIGHGNYQLKKAYLNNQ